MRCKVGDMALITAGPNAGSLVVVDSFKGANPPRTEINWWNVTALNSVTGVGTGHRLPAGSFGRVPDAHLTPLPRDPDAAPEPKVEEPIAA